MYVTDDNFIFALSGWHYGPPNCLSEVSVLAWFTFSYENPEDAFAYLPESQFKIPSDGVKSPI